MMSAQILTGSQVWLDIVHAGSRIDFVAQGPGAGAALFGWSPTDPYEQLSDAYTFMELRRVWPAVGDVLYSTLRRPMMAIEQDHAGGGIDLLRHDYWWPRETSLKAFVEQGKAIPALSAGGWPFAVNLFARTSIGSEGELIDDPVTVAKGNRIVLRAKFDVVIGVMAAGPGIEISMDPVTAA